MEIIAIRTNHRFNFLHNYLSKIGPIKGQSPIQKTTIIETKNYNIIWDMTDGIFDCQQPEPVGIMYKYIELYKNKNFLYVKTNYSAKQCIHHHSLAQENSGFVISCPKFSLYPIATKILNNRKEWRKSTKNGNKIVYAGKDHGPYLQPTYYKGNKKFKYPISWREALQLFNLKDSPQTWEDIQYPSRPQQIEHFKKEFQDIFIDKGHISASEYLNTLREGNAIFQPFGTSIRHSVWEAMMLGIPSVMEDISYIQPDMKHLIITYEKKAQKDDILNKMSSINRQEIIDYFESNMTPEKIVQSVLNKAKEIFS